MYLSKLEIIGFKSFAQRVMLNFDSGISAIVGPNGCGKTNIVDVIRWVLGEQRYSALRSEKMEDVIFNGTKFRKPLGMAEASLVIENTKGILPSEYQQVTVTRRVYRSGESEYLLNRTACRLKDILDLFMDTGMGADAYSVIELKMVETILSDKTDERRRLFEEAAGVTKYKHRRKAAYRKLESVQADLVRVNDIVSEVQKAVNSLERQARRAEQYNDLKDRLRTMEIDLMEREYAQLHQRRKPLEERLSSLNEDKTKIDLDLSNEETQLDELRDRIVDADKRLAEAQRDVSVQSERINRVEQRNLVAAERIKSLHDNIARFEREKAELGTQEKQLAQLRIELGQRIAGLETDEKSAARELETKKTELAELEVRLNAKKSRLAELNERTIALVHQIADLQSVQDRKKGKVENLHGRSQHAEDENAAYEAEIVRVNSEIETLSRQDRQLRRAFTEAEVKFYNAEAKKNELKDALDALKRKELDVRGEIDRRRAKVDLLKGLLESREDLSEGVRFLSTTEKWKSSCKLTVADAVTADEKFRTAIESALGEFAGLMIVHTAREADDGIALLRQEQRGKATFICLERIPEISSYVRLPARSGIRGWATDLAKYDAEFAPVFKFLLDRTLIVDNVEVGAAIAKRVSGIRCVTLDGEILTSVGITRAGSRRQDEGGLIGKQAQMEELLHEIAAFEVRLDEVLAAAMSTSENHDAIDLRVFADEVKRIEKEMNGVEMAMAQLEFEKKRAADIIAKNLEEIASVRTDAEVLLTDIARSAPDIERLDAEKGEVERNVGAATSELEVLEHTWDDLSKTVADLGIHLATVRGNVQNARSDLKRAEQTIADIINTLERRERDIAQAREEILASSSSVEENNAEIAVLEMEMRVLEEKRTRVEDETGRIRDEAHRLELRIKDERRHHDDSLKAVHELELKIQELSAKADHIRARAQEEYELALELKQYAEDVFVDFAAVRDQIQGFRDKIKSLGNINFAAFEEYQTEKQRFEFLSAQRKDLLEAEKTLLDTIEEINATAQRKFLDTFAKIRANFIETFKSLFDPGDECDLKLEENVDPLEARIEIIAKPRGKRPTSIDLLSGGEKTLTAIALLFAIYLVKPSPFCILDEVDAPLDDANIDRFTRILRTFSNNTQFIVVTHNKRTMEAANALYGVTMEEEGVSKIVTVRFNQSAVVQSAAVVSG
jgi:chromosome segregation protein